MKYNDLHFNLNKQVDGTISTELCCVTKIKDKQRQTDSDVRLLKFDHHSLKTANALAFMVRFGQPADYEELISVARVDDDLRSLYERLMQGCKGPRSLDLAVSLLSMIPAYTEHMLGVLDRFRLVCAGTVAWLVFYEDVLTLFAGVCKEIDGAGGESTQTRGERVADVDKHLGYYMRDALQNGHLDEFMAIQAVMEACKPNMRHVLWYVIDRVLMANAQQTLSLHPTLTLYEIRKGMDANKMELLSLLRMCGNPFDNEEVTDLDWFTSVPKS